MYENESNECGDCNQCVVHKEPDATSPKHMDVLHLIFAVDTAKAILAGAYVEDVRSLS